MSPFHKIKDKKKRLSKQAQPETIAINRENHFSLSLPATISANKEKASESVDQTRQWSIKASPSVKLSVAFIITINSQTITITMLKLLIRLFFCLSIFLLSHTLVLMVTFNHHKGIFFSTTICSNPIVQVRFEV